MCASAVVGVAACDRAPVAWSDPVALRRLPGARVGLDATGRVEWTAVRDSVRAVPAFPGACGSSLRIATTPTARYAVWWAVRPDSSATLVAAASRDGGVTWSRPTRVDTADVSTSGCDRPAPSIVAEADDVHIAYAMTASEGTGVFFAHSMDGTSMFHAPVAVEYGDRLVPAAVAADGNRVAVAFEEPNGTARRIVLALSQTLGHIFETHMIASRSEDAARMPDVALRDRVIAVSWLADDSAAQRVVRVGRIQ